MSANLKWKAIFIAGVILVCIVGLVGIPDVAKIFVRLEIEFRQSHQARFGPCRVGTHLILQVQVQEAVSQETDQVLDNITKQLSRPRLSGMMSFAS